MPVTVFIATPFDQIESGHLNSLVDNEVQESRDLEFKRDVVGDDTSARREFLKDVTALANTAGGFIVIGVEHTDGVATGVPGINARPADDEILRLENMLNDAVEPRIVGVRTRAIRLTSNNYALLIHVPASWNPPHRVSLGRYNRYFARNSAGVYELSVEQLRSVFLGGADLERRMRDFRTARIDRLKTADQGVFIGGRCILISHLFPLSRDQWQIDLGQVDKRLDIFIPPGPIYASRECRYNFDGVLIYRNFSRNPGISAYTQVFRDGRIEMARGGYVDDINAPDGDCWIDGHSLCVDIESMIRKCATGAFGIGVLPPVAVMVSFVGGSFSTFSLKGCPSGHMLDRDILLLEPVIFQDGELVPGWQDTLRPIFDSLWMSYGLGVRCPLFTQDGVWKGVPPTGWLS